MLKILKVFFVIFILFTFSFSLVSASNSIVPQGSKYNNGSYELDDLVGVGINVSNLILGIVGSLALLMFVIGGFLMLISAGNSEKVAKAKNILVAAVIGLALVFASYLIINFVMETFGLQWGGDTSGLKSK
jgi:hypothetical protein